MRKEMSPAASVGCCAVRVRRRKLLLRYPPLAAERIASLLLLPCSGATGIRVDEHASQPLRGYPPEALLGGGGPGNRGEVLGHPPLKSTPRAQQHGISRLFGA